jgi:hypothetical protein
LARFFNTAEEVPEESKFLLEVDFARLVTGNLTTQHYWVHAVKAAVVAGRGRRPSLSERPPILYGDSDDTTTASGSTDVKRTHGGSGSLDDMSNKHRRPN